jgi:dTDP-glucose pyrophosphorylase/CBS domain-containing protein
MNEDFAKNIINEQSTLKEALEKLNSLASRDSLTLFVTDAGHALVGTLTDGDIRRGLLSGITLADVVGKIMQRKFKFIRRNGFDIAFIEELRKKEIELIPLLNEENQIIKIIDLNRKKSILPLDAMIMAGGEGTRLRPLTLDIPKPLVQIGGKAIIDYNIDRLDDYGVDNFFVSIKYLGEKIKAHLGDGSDRELRISYTREEKPLGTIGALTLVENFQHDVILIMNSDLLTNIDFEDFYKSFMDGGADMGVASIPYQMSVPYAVFELDNMDVKSLKEKPTYTYYSNAGIYLIRKKLIDLIPRDRLYNATDLMDEVIARKMKLVHYPILGYWLDIGKYEDYYKAQEDIKHIKF